MFSTTAKVAFAEASLGNLRNLPDETGVWAAQTQCCGWQRTEEVLFSAWLCIVFLHPWDTCSPGCEMMMSNASKHLGHPLLIEHFFAGIWWSLSNPLSCYIHMLIVPVTSDKSNVPSRRGSRLDRQKKSIKRITAVIWHFLTQPHAQVWCPTNHFSSSNTVIE